MRTLWQYTFKHGIAPASSFENQYLEAEMANKSRKQKLIVVPKDTIEANASLYTIGTLDREIKEIEAKLSSEIALLREVASKKTKALAEERKSRLAGLEEFASNNRTTLLLGDKKSVEFSFGTFGWRWTPPKVELQKLTEEALIALLKKLKMKRFVRVKESLDKEALLKERPEISGVKYTQREEFFVEVKTNPEEEASQNVIDLCTG
jgi:phage host-nuclease inhibitor protein Gam